MFKLKFWISKKSLPSFWKIKNNYFHSRMIATIFFSYLTSQKKPISIMNFNWTCKIIPNFNSISTHKKQKSIQIDFSVGPHMLFHWACKSTKLELNEGASYCLGRLQKPRSAGPAALTVAAVVAAAAGHGAARRDGAGAAHGVGRGARWRPRRVVTAMARGGSEYAAQAPRHRVYTTMRVRSQSQSTTRSLIWTHPSKKWTRPVTVPRHLGQETGESWPFNNCQSCGVHAI